MPKIFKHSRKGFTQKDIELSIKRVDSNLKEALTSPGGEENVDIADLRIDINNILQKARHPVGNPISNARLRRLREIAQAEMGTFIELIEEQDIRPLEAVVIFLGGALFFMQGYVKGDIKQ